MKTFKKSVAAFLVVLMLLTSAPMQAFTGIELPDFFSSEAKAAGVPGYSAGAAVQWALDHYEDIDSKLTGKGYWTEGGDCANFVSQCVYMGGIDMKNEWYSNGYWRVWDPFTWIRAHELYEYMVELGGVSINNPKASDLSVGDLVFYKTRSDGKMHHSAIVVEINNGVPVICAHSVLNNYGVYEKYKDPNWTLGYSGSRIYAVKMYGDMCYAENPRNFTVYTAKSGARKSLYASPSASSAIIGSTMAESHTYIHVYEERTVNGIKWGKMQWAGNWAWTKLSGFNRKDDIASYRPSHDFGAWKTIAVANCVNEGIAERVCKRCGHTERKTTPKFGHTPGAEATCLTAQICTVCDTVLVDALGHNFEGDLKMPSCTEAVTGSYICTRCGFSYDVNEKWTEYTVPMQEYNGHYYQIFNDAMTWQEAKELCESLRGHLIVINDEAEQNFMTELVADASKDNLWIGLYSDDDTLSWKWVNGEEVGYTNWGGLEPTEDITELYVHTYARDYNANKPAGVWNNMQNNGIGSAGGDYYTTSNYGFICEWDSYEDYPDIWKEETSASIKSETGYTYKEKETVTSYETSLDGYTQDGGEWVQQSSGTIDYVSSWPSGFNTSHSLYSTYNKTPKTESETATTKTTVSTTTKGYVYWHWCRGSTTNYLDYSRRVSDCYTSEFNTFHAFYSTTAKSLSDGGSYDDGFIYENANACVDSYWWLGQGSTGLLPVKTCSWTSYNKLFNYYKWSADLGYTAKENLPDAVVSMIDNGTANTDYQLGNSKTVYSYRLDALGHQMGEWYTVTVATCLENGLVRRDCQRCEYYETDETTAPCIEVKDDAVSPTCIDTGLTEGSHCGVCGKTIVEQQIIPTTEHPFGEWKEVYPISCGKDGLEERICSYCGFTDQRAIINPDPDHLGPVTKETIAPGCEHLHAQGWTEYHCEKCDERWTDDFTDPLTAVWGEWTVTIEPDCSLNHSKEPTENGERERICQLCGAVDRETLLAEHELEAYEISSTCISGGETGEKCKICNQIWMDTVDPLGHLLYDDWYTVYEAKCEEPGQERRDCHRDGCEYHETRIIDPINHDYKEIYTVDATCDKQGYTHYVCNNDNSHEYKDYNKPELGHVSDNNWIVTKEPTCAEKGEEQCKCIRYDDGDTCGKVYTREVEINPDAHSWDDGVIDPESTCKVHGINTYTCKNDNSHIYIELVKLNPNNHVGETFIENVKTETCTEDGYTGDKYCSDCDAILETGEVVDKLGHDIGEWNDNNNATHTRECQRDNGCTYSETENCTFGNWIVTKEATCTEKGSKERTCTECGYKEKAEISLEEHNPDEAVIENRIEPKCEEKGSYDEVVYCTECKKELSRENKEIPAIGHDWDNGVINPESTCNVHGTKTYTCQNDSSHTKTESVELNPDNHVGGTYIENAKTENCTEDGYTGDKYCLDCDALLESGEIIDKLGHDIGEWNDNNNATHTRECQRDNDCTYSETENCTFGSWVVTKEATCTEKGSKERTCTECGYKETAEISLKEHNPDEAVTENRIEPKCEEKGSYSEVVYCTECTKELSRVEKEIEPIGHDWGKWSTVKEPTYDEAGEKQQICNNDSSHINKEVIPVLTRPSDDNENIETDKTVDYDELTGEAIIRLLASSKGETITTKSRIPLDIVLVLDQSGSMGPKYGNLIEDLKDAVEKFNTAIYNDAVTNGIDHRIAMVGFAMQNATGGIGQYENTEVLTTGGEPIKYNSLSADKMNEVYKNALVSVDLNGEINPVITLAKENLEAEGATAADLGLDMACKIFSQNENDGSRKRIVVFMTDGVPTYSSSYNPITVENAIAMADLLKDTYEADVYSVGVLADNVDNRAITFLNNVASADDEGNKLYYDSTDAEQLVVDFENIAEDSTVIKTAFDDITLVDTVSSAFTLTYLQEQQLRVDAMENLGVHNEDITVTRYPDGTTEVEIRHISPEKVEDGDNVNFVVDFSFSVTANENALVADSYVTNTDNAGVIIGTKDVYEKNFVAPSDEVEGAEGVICFNVNGITYHVVRVHAGDKVEQPEISIEGDYTFSGWDIPDEITFDGGKYTIDSTLTQAEYTVTWETDGNSQTDKYHYGNIIEAPTVGLNSLGDVFISWDKSVPTTMPAKNLTFTAVYGEHEHKYEGRIIKKASCSAEGSAEYKCLCGDSYTEALVALSHKWATRATTSEENESAYANVYCINCGESPDKNLSYTVKGKVGRTEYEYDLKLVDAENIAIDLEGNITVSLPIPEEMSRARNIEIYREEADGSLTDLNGTKSGSFITFTTDHFSRYIIKATYECDETGNHTDSNCDRLCDICDIEYSNLGHSYTSKVTAPTCITSGYTTYTCSKCGNSYTDNETAALGHDMSAYTVTKQPTCTDNGTETSECSRCDKTETKSINATGHTYKDGVCTSCGKNKVENCSHLCHKSGFMGLIWKIVRFFWKLFKIQPVCDCGVKHY